MVSSDRIKFPEPYCSNNKSHYFVTLEGDIWRCEYCWATKWLPPYWNETEIFSNLIKILGLDKAYNKMLIKYPATKIMLQELEDMRLARKYLPEVKFSEFVRDSILSSKLGK